jgi:hypothetical protein
MSTRRSSLACCFVLVGETNRGSASALEAGGKERTILRRRRKKKTSGQRANVEKKNSADSSTPRLGTLCSVA